MPFFASDAAARAAPLPPIAAPHAAPLAAFCRPLAALCRALPHLPPPSAAHAALEVAQRQQM
ncbi:hypothetical protein JL100_030085 (plasmid) [Skermanella mucosa]|uniref:hypothetical protein n=1 Tax=Skermanella mucosa TaxID=1789672 RepID=UPI001E292D6A|nr:hypothetical protein [Skermanella mucosa]UEM24485.1 hypothetical protein JL100_030085 [Skermanella mucosa]